jgi:rhamnosyltransferase
MPSTSRNFLTRDIKLHEVDVLLATFNGEKYIGELLESLKIQKGVRINLYISDDGSMDSTIPICNKYADAFASFSLRSGPGKGSTQNFIFMLNYPKSEYIFFADQDDVWEDTKILDAISMMYEKQRPVLHVARAMIHGTKKEIAPPLDFPLALFRNRTQGNCLGFNAAFLREIKFSKYMPVHYDWYFYLIGVMTDSIIVSNTFTLNYRIHDSNQIGLPSDFEKLKRFTKFLFLRDSKKDVLTQFLNLQRFASPYLNLEKLDFLDFIIREIQGDFLVRIRYCIKFILKHRSLDALGIALQITVGAYRK